MLKVDFSKYSTKKLHLGCGDMYFDGFINIDFPQNMTVQNRKRLPDIEHDFLDIDYPLNYFEEIQLHHVFEHFQRHIAIGMLCRFNKMLELNGRLMISVPDTEVCISQFGLSSSKRKKELIRHMYGSHESFWATHHEGWYLDTLKEILGACGYEYVNHVKNNTQWPSVTILVKKITVPNINNIVKFLEDYDFGDGMLKGWIEYIGTHI